MNAIAKALRKILDGGDTPEPPKPPIDLSPEVDPVRKVLRVVGPHDHIGTAHPGDRVLIDAAELRLPAIAGALLTLEEADAREKREAKRLLAFVEGQTRDSMDRWHEDDAQHREEMRRANESLMRGKPKRDLIAERLADDE